MGVLSNRVLINRKTVEVRVLSEAHEVLEITFQRLVFELDIWNLLLHGLVFLQEALFFFVYDSHLVNEVLSSCFLVITVLQPRKTLVGFQQFSLVLLHYELVLLPSFLKLHVMTVYLVLQIKVFLEKLVPLALTNALTLLQFFDESSASHVFLTQILQQVGKYCRLLLMIMSVWNWLHSHFHVVFQVIKILLLKSERICQLHSLSLKYKILFSKVLAPHLIEQLLRFWVFKIHLFYVFLKHV